MDELIADDLRETISISRELSIAWRHGFINYDHLFVAILKTSCMASVYTSGCNREIWETKIKKNYPVDDSSVTDETLPLTVHAERVITHAFQLAEISDEKKINSVHLLLSILSYENEVSTTFSKMGILFEDISGKYYKKIVKAFAPDIAPILEKHYTRFGLFFLSTASKAKKIAYLIENAFDLLMYGQYNDCISICRIGLSIAPANEIFMEILTNSYIRKRDFSAALPVIADLIAAHPGNLNYRQNAAYINDELGNYDEATAIIDNLLEEQPGNADFLNNKGFNLLKQEQYAAAVPFFKKTIEIDPELAYPWNNLGYAKHRLGDSAEGLSLIDKSLELDKGNSYAYKNKGIVFLDQGNKAAAIKNFTLALKFHYTEKYGDEVLQLLDKLKTEG
ncbi:MAG TPA: tetratricopeptide repeat protein [Chitinophagaceae bacterium]|nr:tetratricopeptide repeat protein [Chitinophagaceae bacterium]